MGSPRTKLGGSGVWLGAAKLWFIVASYAISIGLTHALDTEVYGNYVFVARLIAVPNMVIIYTILFSVSRPMAGEFDDGCPSYASLRRRGGRLALKLGGPTSLAFFLAAPLFGRIDPALPDPVRVVAPITLVYGLYAVNLGTLNAVRRFGRQASLDILMATAKASLMVGAAVIGMGLVGTVAGFTIAAVVALGVSVFAVRGVRPRPVTDAKAQAVPMAAFAGALIAFTAFVNLLQSADILILKSFAQTQAQDQAVGMYASALQVALVPYSLMNAIALLVFPLVASIDAQKEPARVTAYLTQTAKVVVLLLALMSAVGSACAQDIQALLFPEAYGAGASQLRLLVWGFSGYSLAVTIAWIFNSAKRSGVALRLVGAPLLCVVVLAFVLVPRMFTDGAALAVAIAGGVGAIAALFYLWRSFRVTVPLPHVLKVAAAVAAVELLARIWPIATTAGLTGKVLILVKLAALTIVFGAVVMITRAVTTQEIKELRRAR